MPLRLGALHDALLDPGNAEKAQRAAEEVATYQDRMHRLDKRLSVLTWMVTFLIGLGIGHFFVTIRILERLPPPP